jgi:hypothetical protein
MPSKEARPSDLVTIKGHTDKTHTVSRSAFERVWKDRGYKEVSAKEAAKQPVTVATPPSKTT